MKTIRKKLPIVLLMPLLLYLCICLVNIVVPKLDPYDFPYKNQPIESVELFYYPWADDMDNGAFMCKRVQKRGLLDSFAFLVMDLRNCFWSMPEILHKHG